MESPCLHVHENILYGEPVTQLQRAFYSARWRGFSTKTPTQEHLDAVIGLALTQAIVKKSQVLFMTTKGEYSNVMARLKEVADDLVASMSAEQQQEIKPRGWFENLWIAPKVVWNEQPPANWVVHGLHKSDILPSWMPSRLLDV